MHANQINVAVIGCGTISEIYLTNMTTHCKNLNVIACADIDLAKANAAKEKYQLPKACSVEEVLSDPTVEIIVNLTIPAAHHSVNMAALNAGKHVYCEKPLALTMEDVNEAAALARSKNLLLGSAPDTFLGAGLQTCRKLIDDGALGTITGFTANLVSPGHELWHPAPVFYYKEGAGPMMDMGPYYMTALVSLLGSISQISCFAKTTQSQREIQDQMVDVEVYTHYAGIMAFENGVIGNVNMSFDVWRSRLPGIEIYGTKGVLYVPDPNMFGGSVQLFESEGLVHKVKTECHTPFERIMTLNGPASNDFLKDVPSVFPTDGEPRSNMRGLGVSDMADSLLSGRESRLSADLSRHVLEALIACDESAKNGQVYQMTTHCNRPELMPENAPLWETCTK